jgi:hypothetical protein
MASLVLGTIGTNLFGAFGGFIGSAVGGIIDAYLFTPDPQDVEGPRLEDNQATSADAGVPIPWVFGADRIGGVIIQTSDIIETRNVEELTAGKKSYKSITYTYSMTLAAMMCEGPILGLGRIWADGNLLRGPREDFIADTQTYRYNVGAFPYPAWYRENEPFFPRTQSRMFEPELLPWSLDPALGNERYYTYFEGTPFEVTEYTRYQLRDDGSGGLSSFFNPLTYAQALEDRKIIYWQDDDTGYMLPLAETVAYDPLGSVVGPDGEVYLDGNLPPDPNGVEGGYYEWSRPFRGTYSIDGNATYDTSNNEQMGGSFNTLYGCVKWSTLDSASNPIIPPTSELQNYYGLGEPPVTNSTPPTNTYPSYKIRDLADFPFAADNTSVVAATGLDAAIFQYTFGFTSTAGFFGYGVTMGASGYFNNPVNQYTETYTVHGTSVIDLATVVLPITVNNPNNKQWTNEEILEQSAKGYLVVYLSFFASLQDDFQDDGVVSMTYLCYFEVLVNGGWRTVFTTAGGLDEIGQGFPESRNVSEAGWYRLPRGTTAWRTRNSMPTCPVDYYHPTNSGGRKSGSQVGMERGASAGWSVSGMSAAPPIPPPSFAYRTWDDYYNLHAALNDFSPLAVLGFQNPDNLIFYRGTDDQPSDPTLSMQRGMDVPGYVNRAYLMMENFQLENFGNRAPSLTFEAVRYEEESISTTIDAVMARAGVPDTNYDITSLPSTGLDSFLPGYSVSRRTSARKVLEPPLNAFRVDVAEIGTQLKFRPRNRAADHVVDYLDLRARPSGSSGRDEALIKIISKDPRELPRTVEILFKDIERDYQQNSARYQRTQTVNDHLGSNSTAVVVYPYFAKVWALESLREAWLHKIVEFTLPYEYLKVSPTDIITIVTDVVIGTEAGLDVVASLTVKIDQVRVGRNGVLDFTGTLTGSTFYNPDEAYYNKIVNENNYVSSADNGVPSVSRFVLLDLPPLNEVDVLYGFYYATSDFNSTAWSGSVVLQSTDGGVNYDVIAVSPIAAAIGTVTTGTLSTIDCSKLEIDTDIIVTLDSVQAQIFSTTVDEMLNDYGNLALIGNELVCFTDVTYLGSRQFRLFGAWSRGLKNTENSVHTVEETFVLLNGAVRDYAADFSKVNIELLYKPVSNGISEALTPSSPRTHTGERLKPFSPVMVEGTRDGSDNLTITWVRRDRLYHSWIDNADLPLSENSLAFEVDILDAPDGAVLRTISSSVESATYTAAEQTTDGLTPGNLVDLRLYQISEAVGRGNPTEELI